MDFAKYKKIKEDANSTTMQSDGGHTITLMHKTMPRIQVEQLKRLKMGDGGRVGVHLPAAGEQGTSVVGKEVRSGDNRFVKTIHKQKLEELKTAPKPTAGVSGFADGGDVEQQVTDYSQVPMKESGTNGRPREIDQQTPAPDKQQMNPEKDPHRVMMMADGGDTSGDGSTAATPATNITINAPAPQAPPSGVPPTAAQPVPYQASNSMSPAAAQFAANRVQFQSPEMQPSEPNVSANGTMNPGAVMRNTQTAAQNQQAIDTMGAKANAVQQQALVQALSDNAAQIANNYNEVKTHTDDYADYMRNHPIEAQNYLKSMGTGEKVATSIGLLLGGFTQGYHGGNNPASDWLNNQINRDIDAQKANQSGQKSILGAYQALYGNSVAATAATKASLIDLYTQKANQIALQLGTPQAAVNAQKFAAQAAIEKSKALQDAAVNMNMLPGQVNPHTAAPAGGIQAPQGGGGAPAPANNAAPDENHIMVPNATLDRVRYMPRLKEQLPEITRQFNQARQSEKALQAVNEKFPQLKSEATYGGFIAERADPSKMAQVGAGVGGMGGAAAGLLGAPVTGGLSIPVATGVGAGLGSGAGALAGTLTKGIGTVLGGQKELQYKADKAALTKILAVALKGAAVNSDQIEEIVKATTPNVWDSKETYNKKISVLRDFIKQNTDTSLLEDPSVGLVKRPK